MLGSILDHLGAILEELGDFVGSKAACLKCKIRSRWAPVQRKRLHDNTQVHTEERKTFHWFYKQPANTGGLEVNINSSKPMN